MCKTKKLMAVHGTTEIKKQNMVYGAQCYWENKLSSRLNYRPAGF